MSTRSTFGTIKRIVAILIAIGIVLSAGIIVGQAPAIFGVEEDPTASITVEDQQTNGTVVEIDEVTLSDGGFVVVSEDGESLAVSDYLEADTHQNVTIKSDEEELIGKLTATVHQDTTGDEEYAYEETDGEEDRPYLSDGFPVSDIATVTTTEIDDPLEESFTVESLAVRPTVTTNETLQVVAEIENPTELDSQQRVGFRLDGQVLEQQVLDLAAGESTEVVFEFDTSDTSPGERTVGVYTDGDGALEAVEFEFHAEPSVAITDISEDEVTAAVATPTESFVAVVADENATNADGIDEADVVGTSDELESGEHENVTIEFDETVDEGDELAAVLFEGNPDDLETASAVEHDDEPVATTFTLVGEDDLEADDLDDASGDDTADEDDE
ncbi:DUF7282 domain-containing protein [Natronobacterium gregoryi]|nr:hypothetical protein [Natronobacterium gregoryi]ELY70067.1 hypothetical protein C490_06874 [Natronobacterium gregoryi SP2]PLK19077.1 hypothetical protein CYV19_16710 [Natronobacterium gregoryi SP2]